MTKTYLMMNLVEKMQSPDQDHRFMGLTDLMTEIKQDPNNFNGDESVETRVLQHVLQLVEDKISEVKNQAVKCLGALIKIVRESQMEFIIDKLIDFSGSKDEELRDIAGLALKTITAELPQESKLAPNACEKLTPKLLSQLKNASTPPETLIETLSILSILISRFPTFVSTGAIQPLVIDVMTPLLNHSRPAVRKRAIVTLSQFLQSMPQALFADVYKSTITPGLMGESGPEGEKTIVQLVSTIARHSPQKLSAVLGNIVPIIIQDTMKDDEDLKDNALQALESIVLRCATEITPFLIQVIHAGTHLIKYDPNFAGGDDDDEDTEMADAEDEEEDEGLDEYSDDEDTSYKVRRSATKLLASVIETRPELLSVIYKEVSPVLISRFGDREETVKLEIWATYVSLLNQTLLYGGIPQPTSVDSPGVGGKRKRDEDEGMDVEETPYTLLKSQVSLLAKALLNQLKGLKTPATVLQSGFSVLHKLLSVLPGCLSGYVSQIASTTSFVITQVPTASNSVLHTSCLSFLSLFFATHSPPVYTNSLTMLCPGLLQSLKERHPRIVSETYRALSSLLNALRPVKSGPWVDELYNECVVRLRSPETDAEVRDKAEECLGDIWVCATDIARSKDGREWDALCRTTGRMDGAIKVVTRVAQEVDMSDKWLASSIDWTLGVLRRASRLGKGDSFTCLDALLRKYKDDIPDELVNSVVPQLKPYLSTNDVALLSHALQLLTLLLQSSPLTTFPVIEKDYLSNINVIAHSPLISGATLDSLLGFYAVLVDADSEIATHIIPNLVIQLEKANAAEVSAANVAKCVGQIIQNQQSVAAGTIAEFSKVLKKGGKQKDESFVLSLLVLGEIGRFVNFAPQKDIFQAAIECFGSSNEEIRSAAAFAVGNIAIGNLQLFLPAIVKLIQTDQEKRLLALHSVKEVVSNSLSGQLEGVAETIWVPLFQDSASAEESTRNVAAACLGKLTTTNPSRYLPQLQARIRDPDAATRATVVATIRYTFADAAHSYDDLLSGVVVDFLVSITDEDLTVRRLALSALNSAARNKPQLIRDHLNNLLPNLYNETAVNPALVRTVQMGPWTHTVDDGLEARKTAYETMYTLLDTCLSKLDLHEFISKVVLGLSDNSDEVKVICHMMLFRLSQVAPTSVIQRLEEVTTRLEKTMKGPAVTKDTVKQDLERTAELQRSVVRAVAALHKVTPSGTVPRFDALVEEIQRGSLSGDFKELTTS